MAPDRLTEKALNAFFGHGPTVGSWQTDPHGAMRSAIRAVQPEIERSARAEQTRVVANTIRISVDGVHGSFADVRRAVADYVERFFGLES